MKYDLNEQQHIPRASISEASSPPASSSIELDTRCGLSCREPSNVGQSVAEIEAAVQAEQTAKLLERRTAEVDAERETVIKLQK
jgi:hypothetical protein